MGRQGPCWDGWLVVTNSIVSRIGAAAIVATGFGTERRCCCRDRFPLRSLSVECDRNCGDQPLVRSGLSNCFWK